MRKNPIENIYPLSPVQQGMLFHTMLAPREGLYVQQRRCLLRGPLDVAAFREAWRQVFERHGALRTAFNWEQREEPFQIVLRQVELPWEEHDWRGLGEKEQDERFEQLLAGERARGFDLRRPPLSRLRLIRTADDAHRFVWSLHHLLLDGWSLALVLKEVFARYEAACLGLPLTTEPARPFADYIAWLRRQDTARAEHFWRETLDGITGPTPLGVARRAPGSADEGTEGYDAREVRLSEEATRAVQTFAPSQQLTLNTLLQGAWALLLARYCGERDVVFGTTVSGRPPALPGVETMVGMLINTLPVRVRVPGDERVIDWLRAIQARHLEAQQYDFSPLVEVQRWSRVAPNLPLFHSLYVFKNYIPVEDSTSQATPPSGVRVEDIDAEDRTNYPLTLSVTPGRELSLQIEYDRALFDLATVRRMLRHIRQLLAEFAGGPALTLAQVSPLTDEERARLLVEWNDTRAEFPAEACLHELFERQAAETPHATAVVCADGRELTFDELNRRANQLARHLRGLGVGADTLVGLCVERSPEMLVGLLGVLKAGGAYVPLDPNYPRERLAYMLSETAAPVLLTQRHLADGLPACAARVLSLDADWPRIEAESDANPPRACVADNLAYAIFTSGSTGKPKAALVAHRALVNYATEMVRQFGLRPSDRVLQFASPAFDVLAEEVFPTWLAGASVVLPEEELLFSCDELTRTIAGRGVTGCELPAAYWQEWVQRLASSGLKPPPSLRFVLVGCERPTPESLALWDAFGLPLVYVYGITETTITSTLYKRAAGDDVFELPIGRPVANTRVYVLDERMQLVPAGVRGELYIAGEGLGRGYLNRPDLTAERFRPDPFSPEPGARIYKTGDVARLLSDGNVEFFGRVDNQVKVRGYRIELGEIEAALAEHETVRECCVVAREDAAGEKRVVAYVVARTNEGEPSAAAWRAHLQQRLPQYMIPTAFVTLDEWPLTANGKVDRKALPAPESARPETSETYEAPRNSVEEKVAAIWGEVLGLERVGVFDNFFDLGGHSLLAVRVITRVREAFEVELPLRSILDAPTVAALAVVVVQHQAAGEDAEELARILAELEEEGAQTSLSH
ncbi:MAG TPA: amino acid adenylation domain-containing protein [Pyrinomonadaceae bacterium]|nr:amino acid adenylation domain-containing protein [Pyrinomonadaceae bacterium]